MAGRIIETLRALQRLDGGGNFFGVDQAQFFTPKFTPASYAVTTLSPSDGFYVAILYRIRFTPDLHPNAFYLNLQHQGDPILAAQLDGGYIATGFGDDGSLLVPLTVAKPLLIRIENNDTVPKMWSADFDALTVQTAQEWQIALKVLNDEHPDIAALLARGDPYQMAGVGMAPMGEPGGQRPQQDTFQGPLGYPDAQPGGTRSGIPGTGSLPPDQPGGIRGGP